MVKRSKAMSKFEGIMDVGDKSSETLLMGNESVTEAGRKRINQVFELMMQSKDKVDDDSDSDEESDMDDEPEEGGETESMLSQPTFLMAESENRIEQRMVMGSVLDRLETTPKPRINASAFTFRPMTVDGPLTFDHATGLWRDREQNIIDLRGLAGDMMAPRHAVRGVIRYDFDGSRDEEGPELKEGEYEDGNWENYPD